MSLWPGTTAYNFSLQSRRFSLLSLTDRLCLKDIGVLLIEATIEGSNSSDTMFAKNPKKIEESSERTKEKESYSTFRSIPGYRYLYSSYSWTFDYSYLHSVKIECTIQASC